MVSAPLPCSPDLTIAFGFYNYTDTPSHPLNSYAVPTCDPGCVAPALTWQRTHGCRQLESLRMYHCTLGTA